MDSHCRRSEECRIAHESFKLPPIPPIFSSAPDVPVNARCRQLVLSFLHPFAPFLGIHSSPLNEFNDTLTTNNGSRPKDGSVQLVQNGPALGRFALA